LLINEKYKDKNICKGAVNMPRFIVEVPHEGTKEACDKAIKMFLETGSHFMTNADWGCEDGEHKAWFILDIEDKDAVLQIIPPYFRQTAKIVALTKFSMQDISDVQSYHSS
jgi:hypothetical protein